MDRLSVFAFTCLLFVVACSDGTSFEPEYVSLFNSSSLEIARVTIIQSEIELTSQDLNNKEINIEIGESSEEVFAPVDESGLNSQAVLSSVDGYLAYYRENGSTWQVWTANQADDTKTLIYSSSNEVQSVAVSSNGNWVAASIANSSGSFDIYLFDVLTVSMVNLTNTNGKDELDVSMSADGSKLVYTQPTNAGLDKIRICDYSSSSNSCSVSTLGANDPQIQASISGNGNYIALIRKLSNGRDRVLLYDVTANTYTSVISRPEPLSHPSVNNEGTKVMYLRDRTASTGKYIVKIKNLSTNQVQNELSDSFIDHPNMAADAAYFTYEAIAGANSRAFSRNIVTNQRASSAGGNWNYGGAYWQKTTGSLDLSFGTGGKVTIDSTPAGYNEAFAVSIDSSGRYVLGGGSNGGFGLSRFNSDGTVDTTFGTNGQVITDVIPNAGPEIPYDMIIDSKGKILLAGIASANNSPGNEFALVRYLSNGTLDTSFGPGGMVFTDFGTEDRANAITIDSNGKIVVVGTANTGSYVYAVARYNTNGTLDTSFGTNGKVTTDMGAGWDVAYDVLIDSNNKIIVVGETTSGSATIARYNTNGTLDTSFGLGGKALFGSSTNRAKFNAAILDPNDYLVLTGSSSDGDTYLTVTRIDASGTLTAFNALSLHAGVDNEEGLDLSLDANGNIVVTGTTAQGIENDFLLVRLKPDLSRDLSFGVSGVMSTDFTGFDDVSNALVIDAQGYIVLAGKAHQSLDGFSGDFAIARYNP